MSDQFDIKKYPTFLGKVAQLSFVVRDFEEALNFWTESLDVGPFVVMEDSLGDRPFIHRGKVSEVKMSLALAYLGDVQIELICQLNSEPSPYAEFYARGSEGLQHVAFMPDDYDSTCRRLKTMGFEEVSYILASDGSKNASYYGSPHHIGTVFEITPMTPMRRMYLGAIKKLSEDWDGNKPVWRFATREDFLNSELCRV
ncbi:MULTISPECIES: VOC family protein [unclassified Rhodococcus (in: high G+C Gram-positive bacteria)]|uniref:VOC family protein n=1 Tax=unclassified Rhodococcus (in: high G+C Gram-positive bacteria) TaxID=192944 RepID=UPI0015E8AA81|nr:MULTISPECIES: VOC family protein [unclassified Rhodococcus (in: high G+C Gram-positive bacteria)]